MNYTEADIRELAYRIWQRKKSENLPNADDEKRNWFEAQLQLFLTDLIHRGTAY